MTQTVSIANFMRTLNLLGAAEWWSHRFSNDVHASLDLQTRASELLERVRAKALAEGATDDQMSDAYDYARKLIRTYGTTASARRPLSAGLSFDAFEKECELALQL